METPPDGQSGGRGMSRNNIFATSVCAFQSDHTGKVLSRGDVRQRYGMQKKCSSYRTTPLLLSVTYGLLQPVGIVHQA